MDTRLKFSARTKQIVAARAGYRCSILGCDRVTIGPDFSSDKFLLSGVAAHIFSAAESGPRGWGGLSPEEVASVNNAIWVCANHAKLIDDNRGSSYPAPLLLSYKGLQEAKIAREQGGMFAPIGWFQQLTIHTSPLFEPETALQFGKVTLILGGNELGKSALCEWLAGFGESAALWRWIPNKYTRSELDIEVLSHTPEPQTARLTIASSGCLKFNISGKDCPIQPLPLRFVFVREQWLEKDREDADDMDLICSQLNADPATLPNLFTLVDDFGFGWVRNLRFVEEPSEDGKLPKRRLLADVRSAFRPGLQFRGLSHSEQTFVILELAIALARFSAQFVPTMLLLDGGMHRLDASSLNELATHLSSTRHLFQTVIVITNAPENLAKLRWSGWETVRLDQGSKGTTVNQHPF